MARRTVETVAGRPAVQLSRPSRARSEPSPDLAPEPARGYLRFQPEQIAALAGQRVEASRRRIAAYLR